jgi:hypothetical protein
MEKCKTKLVPKLVAKQNKFTQKFIKDAFTRRIAQIEKENKKEPVAGLEKKIKRLKKMMKPKKSPKADKSLTKVFTSAYCNPGCEGTIFQEGDLDIETFVNDYACKKSKRCDRKRLVKRFKETRKRIVKGRKRILDDDSFYHAFVNKTKKAQLRKDGAISGCAVMSLV